VEEKALVLGACPCPRAPFAGGRTRKIPGGRRPGATVAPPAETRRSTRRISNADFAVRRARSPLGSGGRSRRPPTNGRWPGVARPCPPMPGPPFGVGNRWLSPRVIELENRSGRYRQCETLSRNQCSESKTRQAGGACAVRPDHLPSEACVARGRGVDRTRRTRPSHSYIVAVSHGNDVR